MLKFIFDLLLVCLALFFTMSFSMISSLFLLTEHDKFWITVVYAFVFLSGVVGIKSLGRYYVQNFL